MAGSEPALKTRSAISRPKNFATAKLYFALSDAKRFPAVQKIKTIDTCVPGIHVARKKKMDRQNWRSISVE